jgi:hypothetical protein
MSCATHVRYTCLVIACNSHDLLDASIEFGHHPGLAGLQLFIQQQFADFGQRLIDQGAAIDGQQQFIMRQLATSYDRKHQNRISKPKEYRRAASTLTKICGFVDNVL